ncbi:MAG: PASTA domain-containing protein [Bacteroidetes bacterium]|nr:PASTA domain-containing protein [Bacteroidota bacterium]
MTKLIPFLKSKVFFRNIGILLGLLLLVFGAVSYWLGSYTHHGESISVPDLRGQKIERLKTFLADKNLDFKVNDSLFDLEKPPGTVLEQDPAPKSKVKEGRTIYLTVNSLHPPDVKMPDLADVSLRQAEAILQSFGLRVGQLSYKPDLAKNAVLDQRYKGTSVRPGKSIPKGSEIDLVLGDGVGSVEVPVPDLSGQTYGEALFVLKGSSLNVGMVHFDPGVRDSTRAVIYKQIPEASDNATINQGEAIEIYLH